MKPKLEAKAGSGQAVDCKASGLLLNAWSWRRRPKLEAAKLLAARLEAYYYTLEAGGDGQSWKAAKLLAAKLEAYYYTLEAGGDGQSWKPPSSWLQSLRRTTKRLELKDGRAMDRLAEDWNDDAWVFQL